MEVRTCASYAIAWDITPDCLRHMGDERRQIPDVSLSVEAKPAYTYLDPNYYLHLRSQLLLSSSLLAYAVVQRLWP